MTRSYVPTPIVLEMRDIGTMLRFRSDLCKKCETKLKEGDIVVRIGLRPPKYYHQECFKQY